MKLSVYGKILTLHRENNSWVVYYSGDDGKKRFADDIKIPQDIPEENIAEYLADVFHEYATPENSDVKIIHSK
ncbi:MAG: hypothetical protein OEZ34_04135 [Spirochaetia bacterium]|nr:hypothetical protein [Spirochaetia bacterium]